MNIKFYFDIIDSKPFFQDRNGLSNLFKNLKDGRYFGEINLVRNNRSREQNNSIWAIPYMYFERALIETGNFKNPSKLQVHNWCMHHCLPSDYKERIRKEWKEIDPMVDMTTGEIFKDQFRLTTTKMTTVDAMNYYENLQQFYSENLSSGAENDFIPDPDKNWKDKKLKKW